MDAGDSLAPQIPGSAKGSEDPPVQIDKPINRRPPEFVTLPCEQYPNEEWVQRSGSGGRLNLLIGQSGRLFKDRHKHFARKFASLRILIRRMVRRE